MNPFSSLRLIPFLAFLLLINFGFKPFEGQSDFEEFENNSNTSSILYISPSGSNVSGNGTESSPWQTLAFAVGKASFGDTIFFLPGTYVFSSTVDIPPGISLKGAGETSVITSLTLTNEWTPILNLRSNSLVDGNQSISFLKFDGNNLKAAQAIWIAKRNNVEIHDCKIIDFKFIGIQWSGDGGSSGNGANDPESAFPPSNHVTGSRFFNNVIHNNAIYTGGLMEDTEEVILGLEAMMEWKYLIMLLPKKEDHWPKWLSLKMDCQWGLDERD
jgi:hypothetical protein